MLAIGDLLIDAIRLELHSAHGKDLERRKVRRAMVNHLAQGYASIAAATLVQKVKEMLKPSCGSVDGI